MSIILNVYPRGFCLPTTTPSGTNLPSFILVDEDVRMKELYKLLQTLNPISMGWDFEASVIQRVSCLIGNFENFMKTQAIANDYVYDLNMEFLYDTLNFIRGGDRKYSLRTWISILDEYPKIQPGVGSLARAKIMKFDKPQENQTPEFLNYIGTWCSRDGGFEDMLCTAVILFTSSYPRPAVNS